jgi:molybdate transport system regulatory protein
MPRTGPLKITLRLYVGDERAFGPGRADLLAAIDREGSISAAGRSLGMSYRYAWMLVESMNHCFAEKLVEAMPGGRKGGRAALTDAGRRALLAYRALEQQIVTSAQGDELDQLIEMLKPWAPH